MTNSSRVPIPSIVFPFWQYFLSATTLDATYDPADDKLRLRASSRLDTETYASVETAGFGWATKHDRFFAIWTPVREDLLVDVAGNIDDEATTLEDRPAKRAERFTTDQGKRAAESDQARKAVTSVANSIPLALSNLPPGEAEPLLAVMIFVRNWKAKQ